MDEKEILKMIDLQRNHCENQRIGDCVDKDCNDCSARVFYNAGYRKESDTAREIFSELYKNRMACGKGIFAISTPELVRLAEKYGVDLGE